MTAPVERFRTLLSRRFGWRLDNDRGQVAELLASRLPPHRSVDRYLDELAAAPDGAIEVRSLAEALAISETYFFRAPEQFAVLAEVALPAAAEKRPSGPIRILSAGAASGEEAYSVAMTVLKVREHQPVPPVEIVGVDVSGRALAKARRGRYSPWALRGLPAATKSRFFETDGKHFDITPAVASMVEFREGNLLNLATAAPGPWDIVFFRNTLMYFTPDVACGIFAQLSGMMEPGAFLFLGHAETLRGVSDRYALQHSHDTFYYRRDPVTSETPGAAPAAWLHRSHEDLPDPPAAPDDEWFHEIMRATERVAALVDGDRHRPAHEPDVPARPRERARSTAEAVALLEQERYEAALDALGRGTEPDQLLLRALILVNLGRIAEARTACTEVLGADREDAGAYYVLALCEERARNDALAAQHDQMAIQLDDTFAIPHLHAATLARRRGDRAAALRHTARACELLASEDDLRIRLFGGGFTREALLRMCESQMRAFLS